MGDVVDLKPARLEDNIELIQDCCRYLDGLLSESSMRRKWGFAENVWQQLGENSALLGRVEEEQLRRMRSGTAKKEKAQLHVLKAPDVAAGIMNDSTANARHRLDACKVLDDFSATSSPASTPAADRFIITINLGADHVEHYNKSISVCANDTIPHDVAPDISINVDAAEPVNDPPAIASSKAPEEIALDALMARGD